jgi:hypothetical protein
MSDDDDDIPDELWDVIDGLGESKVRHAAVLCSCTVYSTTRHP